eukprot:1159153-Pelagomonas_calceolata.AAC.1
MQALVDDSKVDGWKGPNSSPNANKPSWSICQWSSSTRWMADNKGFKGASSDRREAQNAAEQLYAGQLRGAIISKAVFFIVEAASFPVPGLTLLGGNLATQAASCPARRVTSSSEKPSQYPKPS